MVAEIKLIKIEWSDGVSGTAPENISYEHPRPGTDFDYFRIIQEDDPKHIRWMTALGTFLRSETVLKDTDKDYRLFGFPQDYTFLEHCKSQGADKKYRTDSYLFGHPSGARYRSLNEFMPHLLWLACNTTHDVSKCTCKLCGGHKSRSDTSVRRRAPVKQRRLLSGMSEISKAIMCKAQSEMTEDLQISAFTYRIGEVVMRNSDPFLVAGRSFVSENVNDLATDAQNPARKHTYDLFLLKEPYSRFDDIPSDTIAPYLPSRPPDDVPEPVLVHTASPIAKFNIESSGSASLPGPSYVGWYLGAEKIYHKDLVRLASSSSTDVDIMQLSHIYLNTETGVVCARGDILTLGNESDQTRDDRVVPSAVREFAIAKQQNARFLNDAGLEFEVALSEIIGRFYPMDHRESSSDRKVYKIERGRKNGLPPDLVSAVQLFFGTNDEATESLSLGQERSEADATAAQENSDVGLKRRRSSEDDLKAHAQAPSSKSRALHNVM